MVYVLDILVIGVFGFAVWNGYRRGFVRALSGLLAFVVAAAVALIFNSTVAEAVYDRRIAPAIRETVAEQLETDATAPVAGRLDAALEKLPGVLTNVLAKNGLSSGADIAGRLTAGAQTTAQSIAEQVVTQVIRPTVVALLRVVAFLLLFLAAYLAARLLLRLVDKVFRLPGLRRINRTLGLIPGIINGVLGVVIAVLIIQAIAAAGSAGALITPAVVENTRIVRWIIHHNPVGGGLQQLITTAPVVLKK